MFSVNWAGWLLLFFTYMLLYFHCPPRKNLKLFLALIFVLSFHHAIALINAFVITTPGADADATTFHNSATAIADHRFVWNNAIAGYFYRYFLAFFYKIFGASLLLGEELSVLAFLLSCFVFIKLYENLGYTKHAEWLLILYGALPSMVLLSSVTLREPWQVLFFMLTTYFALKNLLIENITSWVYYIGSSIMLGLFHEGLVIYIFFMAALILSLQMVKSRRVLLKTGIPTTIICTVAAISILFVTLQILMYKIPDFRAFKEIAEGKALSYIESYRSSGMSFNPRTTYGISFDYSSLTNLFLSFNSAFFYYMFAPFPWQVSNFMDLYAAVESVWRILLIGTGILAILKTKGTHQKCLIFLMVTYLMLSALWSLGTISYGTSIRHHLVGYWILILLLGAFLHRKSEHPLKLKINSFAKN